MRKSGEVILKALFFYKKQGMLSTNRQLREKKFDFGNIV